MTTMENSLSAGIAKLAAGDLQGAEGLLAEAAALASGPAANGNLAAAMIAGRALGNLGNLYSKRGMPREALAFSSRALDRFRQCGDPEKTALVLYNMAHYASSLPPGDNEAAKAASYMREVTILSRDQQRLEDADRWLKRQASNTDFSSNGSRSNSTAGEAPPSAEELGRYVTGGAAAVASGQAAAMLPAATQFTSPEVVDEATGLAPPGWAAAASAAAAAAALQLGGQQQLEALSGEASVGSSGSSNSSGGASPLSKSYSAIPGLQVRSLSDFTAAEAASAAAAGAASIGGQASASPSLGTQCGGFVAANTSGSSTRFVSPAPMLEFGFENLWWADVTARQEQEATMLDAVEALLKARAAAADAAARGIAEAAAALVSQLQHTGLGVGQTIHSGSQKSGHGSGGGGVASAVKSAFSSFFGSAGSDSSSSGNKQQEDHLDHHEDGASGNQQGGQQSSYTVTTGGFDTTRSALGATRKALQREALSHARQAASLREAASQLGAFKSSCGPRVSRAVARGNELVRVTQSALANLRRANAQLERARREEEDALTRVQAALSSSQATQGANGSSGQPPLPDSEIQKRTKRHAEALAATEAAENGVRDAADAVVASRRSRDDELTLLAKQLQRVDDERRGAVAKALSALASSSVDAAELAADTSARLNAAVAAIDPAADSRAFLHQRRTAIMLDELHQRQAQLMSASLGAGAGGSSLGGSADSAANGGSAGGAADPDDASHLIPCPISATAAAKHGRSYLQAESDLAPIMYRWAACLLRNEGWETLYGQPLPLPAGWALHGSAAAPAGDSGPVDGVRTTAVADGEEATAFQRVQEADGVAEEAAAGDAQPPSGSGSSGLAPSSEQTEAPVVDGIVADSSSNDTDSAEAAEEAVASTPDAVHEATEAVLAAAKSSRELSLTSEVEGSATAAAAADVRATPDMASAAEGSDGSSNNSSSKEGDSELAAVLAAASAIEALVGAALHTGGGAPSAAAIDGAASSAGTGGISGSGGAPMNTTTASGRTTPLQRQGGSGAGPVPMFEVSLLDQQAARHAFLRALSAKRSQIQNVGPEAFERFVRVFWWCLDACLRHEDARAAQTVLILSETFHCRRGPDGYSGSDVANGDDHSSDISSTESPAAPPTISSSSAVGGGSGSAALGPKEYVQSRIKAHPIWRGHHLWAESFYRACRDEVAKLIDPSAASNSRLASLFAETEREASGGDVSSTGGSGGGNGSGTPSPLPLLSSGGSPSPFSSGSGGGGTRHAVSSESGDVAYAYTQIVFGQLMALALNQSSFGVPPSDADRLITSLASANGLPRHMLEIVRGVIISAQAGTAGGGGGGGT